MEFGVWIPNCRHLATRDVIRQAGRRAEELGYASIWVSDHVVVPTANIANFGERIYDPLVTLGVLAGATERVRLGTTVLIVPYRNAVVMAKMVSTLDDLSDGRLILGIGAGWLPAESDVLGLPFEQRGAMTDEFIQAMQALWTQPSPRFQGQYNSFDDIKFEPKPVQQPHPPLWVGGHSRAAMRRTAEIGESWHPINLPVDDLRAGMQTVREFAQQLGREKAPILTLRNDVHVNLDGRATPSAAHAGRVLAGGPDQIIEQIQELAELGCEHLVLEFLSADARELDEQMAAFAEQVRPALQ